ncbi:MAG: GCG_CRPN prefix-to-repeats domain-containing protein [Hyphomicrobiales bacterium]
MKPMLGLALLGFAAALSFATPSEAAMPVGPNGISQSSVILAYGGCGPRGHRGPYGGCRPGGQWGGYVRGRSCPPGFHLGPYGRRCWPN